MAAAISFLATPQDAQAAGGTAPATNAPGTSTGQIDATQAQADALVVQVATEQETLVSLSERYDQATVRYQQIQANLAATDDQLAQVRQRVAAARRTLVGDAIEAYIVDEPLTQVDTMFSSSATSLVRTEYDQTAVGDAAQALQNLRVGEDQLAATDAALRAQEQQATAQATEVAQAQQAAQAANDSALGTLAGVEGTLGQLVTQRATALALQESQAAVAGADDAAKQLDAEQAALAAQVAQTLAAGSELAAQATDAANQAAASAGIGGPMGTGAPQVAVGPGAVALSQAERFLGVPYVFGGASARGVDCSGLTMLAWRAAGARLEHSAAIQYDEIVHVPLSEVTPGDLLFYDFDGTGIEHVVMYVGSGPYGADTIIQAAHSGTVVEFDPLFYGGLVGAGRP
jgi:cell wall-associated NlpC family hydrolase